MNWKTWAKLFIFSGVVAAIASTTTLKIASYFYLKQIDYYIANVVSLEKNQDVSVEFFKKDGQVYGGILMSDGKKERSVEIAKSFLSRNEWVYITTIRVEECKGILFIFRALATDEKNVTVTTE